MSVYKTKQRESQISHACLDLLAYYAVWGLRVDFNTIFSLVSIRTSHLAIKKQLVNLEKRGKVSLVDGKYGLSAHKYPNQKKMLGQQQILLKKALRWARAIGMLPFVKSIVVVNSVALGNAHDQSDIDLLIVTSPNRIFVSKGILMGVLKLLHQLEDQFVSAGRFSLGMFLTTKGVKMQKDIMKVNEPGLVYAMICAKPIYGASIWYGILKCDPYIQEKLPNFVWPKLPMRIYSSGFRIIDRLDDIGYHRHLRHTAAQPKSHHPDAFIRVRPDIINLHHKGTSAQLATQWRSIRDNI
ncbi:MAG: nucleotidyltransferase domain-containing protein [Patescibacteria group bacterium]|nr:nucleotidyltransferase domain-containing protein [Patescibacteria group bacterium]